MRLPTLPGCLPTCSASIRLAAIATLGVSITLQPVAAQRPPTPPDSTARDSSLTDSSSSAVAGRSAHGATILLVPVFVVFGAVLLTAPAATAFIGTSGENTNTFIQNRTTLFTFVGGHFHDGQTWGSAVELEAVRNWLYFAVSREDYYGGRRASYSAARVGYLFHPKRYTAGGVTIGYRQSDDHARTGGVELGLPLVMGLDDAPSMRLEPTYVFSPVGVLWNYRFEAGGRFPNTSYHAAIRFVSRSRSIGGSTNYADDPDLASFGLVVGAYF